MGRGSIGSLIALALLLVFLSPRGFARSVVGSNYVKVAREYAQSGDLQRAIDTMQRAIDYRDTVERRQTIASYCERQGNIGLAIIHLKRAHELAPTREIVAKLVKLQKTFREQEDERMAEIEEQREAELAKKQAAERRKRLAAIKEEKERRRANLPKLNVAQPTKAPPPTKQPTTAVGVAVTGNLQAFVDGLSSVSAYARRKSALAIAESGRTDLAPRISALLEDDDPFVRMDVADALRTLRSPETVVPLLERLFAEKTFSVQSRLVDAIEAEGSRTALNGLSQYRDYLPSGARVSSHVLAAIARLEKIHDPD